MDTFGRTPSDVLKYIMAFYITRPKFTFEFDGKYPILRLNMVGSHIIFELPNTEYWHIPTDSLKNFINQNCSFDVIGEHHDISIYVNDKYIGINEGYVNAYVDKQCLDSLKEAMIQYLKYIEKN